MATYELKTQPHTDPAHILYKVQAFNILFCQGQEAPTYSEIFARGRCIQLKIGNKTELCFNPQELEIVHFGRKYLECVHRDMDGSITKCKIDMTDPDHGVESIFMITMYVKRSE